MKKSIFGTSVLLAVCLVMISGFPVWGEDVIKVGVIGPMHFLQGKGHWNGALMAQEEINAKGGIPVGDKKYKVELVKADSNEFLNITDATNAMERLMSQDKVDFVVGGFRTEAVLAMQDIAMDYKKIFLGVGAAHPEICARVAKDYNRYKYWFRVSPINSKYLVKVCLINLGTVGAYLKKGLGIEKPKVAVVGAKVMWVDPMIAAIEKHVPNMGMEIVGVWRPSQTTTDVTAELTAIQRKEAQIIFTIFSASAGITFARQAAELKIPAAYVGINVEAQKDGFMAATQGKGDYAVTLNTYVRGVSYNDLTEPFIEKYIKQFGETPPYTAATYDAINIMAETMTATGTTDAEKLIPVIEKTVYVGTAAPKSKFDKEHDVVFGPGFATGTAIQWQDGKMQAWWPNGWEGVTYKGMVPYKLPPWLVEKYKK
ncbi:MAG: ABC transporter substrate-binding protein [Pseudomonadota bacterium]|nr:ABC transporter substrate-binding protein [Desulfobacterales bacterium]MBL6968461.1 ABC transporter substrate-binding protein [Desulfobacteraceae bacterium]MBL7101277.1 ABC transporter substrate-binding protein [Desulfobacteraceae bacterium]MBL7172752.1 ABC transporter substrate-binding protein [Desulfobacteraceae bacterium]